jgi:methionyl aminopeptidase
MTIHTEEELRGLQEAGRLVSGVLCRMAQTAEPGMTRGLRIVRNLCSHGVGGALHEEPTAIPGYYEPRDRRIIRQGMVFTIEPFLSTKARCAAEAGDGWTLIGPKGGITAQYEHTIVVGARGPIVVTSFDGLLN